MNTKSIFKSIIALGAAAVAWAAPAGTPPYAQRLSEATVYGPVALEKATATTAAEAKALCGEGRRVSLDGDEAYDLAKITSTRLPKLKDGEGCDFCAYVAFDVKAEKAGEVRLRYCNNWFGLIFVNGRKVAETKGPWNSRFDTAAHCGAWKFVVVELEAGENEILFRSQPGSDGNWLAGFAVGDVRAPIDVEIDFSRPAGPVKPVNGVGQPPMIGALGSWSMMHYLKEAGIPYSRLHDVGGWLGGGLYVDIPNLFPDFDADENDPGNYRFTYTDSLMKALDENGVEPFFRLGVTIENFVERGYPPVNVLPPKDYAKWARICEHVIRHYTEGWADGFRMKVTYWEIWNEPENNPVVERNPMWRGDWESYMRFYGTVAPYLKAKFPHLKIGGYGHCGFYAAVGSDNVPAANSSPRMEHFVECSHKFLAAARDNKWPLDFFSFHSYSEPKEAMRQVRFADEHLNEYGFTHDKCERIFNEWLPYVSHENLGSALQAAGVAAELIGLQNGPCDVACIYDARCGIGNYSPLFNPLTYKPHKAYYVYLAFNELRKLGTAVRVEGTLPENVWMCAATDAAGARGAVFVANLSEMTLTLPKSFGGKTVVRARFIDADHDFADAPSDAVPTDAVALVEVE